MFSRYLSVLLVLFLGKYLVADELPTSGLELMSAIACVERIQNQPASRYFCADKALPVNIVYEPFGLNYFFCYENVEGFVEEMYMVNTATPHGGGAYQCSINNPKLTCAVENGRFEGRSSNGRFCSYPPNRRSEEDRIFVEGLPEYKGLKICSQKSCDWTKIDWSRLVSIPLE